MEEHQTGLQIHWEQGTQILIILDTLIIHGYGISDQINIIFERLLKDHTDSDLLQDPLNNSMAAKDILIDKLFGKFYLIPRRRKRRNPTQENRSQTIRISQGLLPLSDTERNQDDQPQWIFWKENQEDNYPWLPLHPNASWDKHDQDAEYQ